MIELDQLVRFVQHPVRAFLRRRLGVGGTARDDDLEDALSIELDALEQWSVGERLLEARLAGADRDAAIAAEIARGELPPDLLAESVLADVYPVVEQLVAAAADYVPAAEASASVDVRVELPEGRTLVGTVPGVRGDLVAALTYSRVAPRHRLTAWVYLLALAAAHPATAYEAVTLGRRRADGPRGREVTVARIRLLRRPGRAAGGGAARPRRARRPLRARDARAAAALLQDLGRVRRRGRRRQGRTGCCREGMDVRLELPEGGCGAGAPARARRNADGRRAVRGAAARRRAGRGLGARRAVAGGTVRAPALGRAPRPRGADRPVSASSGMQEFDLCGPLPRGVTLLEASAGTGKTFAIAALVARLVAEGVPPAQLLVVTFTRMATGELRERVRDRLVSAELGLARALAGVAPPADDRVLELLADGSDAEVAVRRRRLADAVSGFDAATIATTHGFCQHVLAGLGVAGDVERDVTFVEDLSDLVEEVVDDLYVRRFHRVARPPFDRAEALRIGRAAIGNPLARLEPVERRPGDEAQTWAMRRRLAEAVREEVEARKRRSGVMTYDDLLTRLRNTLADEEHGAAACAKLREQYHVALVDEFQDTDPIQWEIMRRAFGEGEATLILIGDPKQAVYSFRGADVYAYLSAADSAVTKATLATNWRSDQGLIDALDALFDGAQLGHEGIVHRPVRAAEREPRAAAGRRARDRPAARARSCTAPMRSSR